MEKIENPQQPTLSFAKYSNRVVLKSIIDNIASDLSEKNQRVVVGGWVKSSKEVLKEVPSPVPPPSAAAVEKDSGVAKDVNCVEILQSRIPFFKTIIRILGCNADNNPNLRKKLESIISVPTSAPPPSTVYLQISDGSSPANLQVVVDSALASPSLITSTGTCILVEGLLRKPLLPGKYEIELVVEKIHHIGTVEQDRYPLSKKRLPLEALRNCPHFRPRTTTVGSVVRIRSAMTLGTHTFFQDNGFLYVQLPIITTTDSEGLSEKFQVTTLLDKTGTKMDEMKSFGDSERVNLEVIKAAAKEKSDRVEELKRTESNREALTAAVHDLKKTNDLASHLEAMEKTKGLKFITADSNKVYQDFFPSPAYLTVSGRFHLESYACALGNVYSFGPRFRADKIVSQKNASEMWMVEVEIAFSELKEAIRCAEDYFKFLCKWILEKCSHDLNFDAKRIDKEIINRLETMATGSCEKISYTEAVEILRKVTEKNFGTKLQWGVALNSEHLSYLAEEVYKKPLIIYSHPKAAKPFYVRSNDDGKTTASFDMVLPKNGTVITGSQNEERLDMLNAKIKETGLSREQYEWYLDLRRHGTVKHSGFSLNFELMLLSITGLVDVKDSIPYPNIFGKASI
ncbi:hypothetical protein ACFE04_029426 [Oxalis oulophora]